MTCTTNSSERWIKMLSGNGGIKKPIPARSPLIIEFGKMTNPATNKMKQTLSLTSYIDDTQFFSIDRITYGLTPTYICNYPCASCPS